MKAERQRNADRKAGEGPDKSCVVLMTDADQEEYEGLQHNAFLGVEEPSPSECLLGCETIFAQCSSLVF